MTSYCTEEDVLSVATEFRKDVMIPGSGTEAKYEPNTNTIPFEDVTFIVSEASNYVRSLLSPRYSIPLINSYTPFPPIVIYCAKTYGAILMFQRYGAQSVERNDQRINQLNTDLRYYSGIISNGELRDSNEVRIATKQDPSIQLGSDFTDYVTATNLKELYANGREY